VQATAIAAVSDEITDPRLRGFLSAGPSVKAIQTSGETRVREAVATAMAPFKLSSGGYRLENTFRFLISLA
jgi:hypothetical protein